MSWLNARRSLAWSQTTAQQNNNGQIQAIHYYTLPGTEDRTRSESFTYDAWSRIRQAQTLDSTAANTWNMNWSYDRLGNRFAQSGTGTATVPQPTFTIDTATNRIVGYCYDGVGNLTDEGACPAAGSPHRYTYDGANRIVGINTGSATATYTYSGQLRIKKTNGNGTTIYIYSGDKPIAEYAPGAALSNPVTEYLYAGSQLVASIAGTSTSYFHFDHLSDRAETDSSGNVVRRMGHFPYGESWYDSSSQEKWKFTTYERGLGTGETGLDYAQFRYYSSSQARFMTADLLAGVLPAPQSLNRYAYAQNDPINFTDPLGLCPEKGNPDCHGGPNGVGPDGPRHKPLQSGEGGRGGGNSSKAKHCDFNMLFKDKAAVGADAAIKQRIQDVFNATADPNGNTVGINFDFTGKPDGTFVISAADPPKDQNGHARVGMLVNGTTPTIYASGFVTGFYYGNIALSMGTQGAHEIAHKLGAGDLPYDPAQNNANLMTVDSAADHGLLQQVWSDASNPTIQGFGQFSATEIAKMFKRCLKAHQK